MIIPDLNLLIYAYDQRAPQHPQAHLWWAQLLRGDEPVGMPWVVLTGFVRLTIRPGILARPLSSAEAIQEIQQWLTNPHVSAITPSNTHPETLGILLQAVGNGPNTVTDAHIGALAIEHNAVVHSNDGITRALELTSQTAVWYRSGKPPVLIRWVLIRDPQGSFATQALLCTDPAADPTQILEWFVLRWQLEVTFHEVRTHLGVETQRQWSDLAIARTTPALLGLFSWTTLAAHALQKRRPMTQRKAAWYDKPSPTFVDAIALARRHLWLASEGFSLSVADPDIQELPVALYHRLVDSLAYAA